MMDPVRALNKIWALVSVDPINLDAITDIRTIIKPFHDAGYLNRPDDSPQIETCAPYRIRPDSHPFDPDEPTPLWAKEKP